MNDLIIVGDGIAGCVLAWQCHFNNQSVILMSNRKKGSSAVAAGVYNPTILKRFTAVWKAQELLHAMQPFYERIESVLGIKLCYATPILRRFHDAAEVRTWQKKATRPELLPHIDPDVVYKDINGIDAQYGYGLVHNSGWLDTVGFMKSTWHFFASNHQVIEESFDYEALVHQDDYIKYRNWCVSHIIFAEGYALQNNPYFNYLPLQGNKGEVITIKVPGLKLDYTIKSSVFIMPYKEDLFWVGATYNRYDMSEAPTTSALHFLTSRLERFLKLPYEIVDHKYGIRPTTVDRRPFLGRHVFYKRYYVFNGMGSRAVLLAPWASFQLHDYIHKNINLHPEVDIQRF